MSEVKQVKKTTVVESGVNEFVVKTNLKGRHEAFKMMALSEALGLPLLFLGVPGIGKTNCVRDYGKARCADGGKLFILETDEYTRPAEIKGRPNMKKLAEENVYEVLSPIVESDFIVVNEIDKASGGLRHGLMSVMCERVLFNGNEEVQLNYKAFIGTCNEIPKEEKGSPFWDRFVLKSTLGRMSQEQIMDYFRSGHKEFVDEIKVRVPTMDDIKNHKAITEVKMRKLVDVCYGVCSDRTITHLPRMVKAVAFIWSCGTDAAFVKTAEILAGPSAAKALSDQITTREMKNVSDRIDLLHGITSESMMKSAINDITVLVTNYTKDNKLTKGQLVEIEEVLNQVLSDKGVDINALRASMAKQA